MLRRILPQLATALVNGEVERLSSMDYAGRSFALGRWQEWPAEQSSAIGEFLDAWWVVTLADPDADVPAHAVLAMLVEASGALDRWLGAWVTENSQVANQRLAEAFGEWNFDLLHDELPWSTWTLADDDKEILRTELTAWLLQHAPARLRTVDTDPELPHRIRLLGIPDPARSDDPHWPTYTL